MRRITSALFLDFDNIFSGLLEVDRAAAMALVEQTGAVLDRLQMLDEQTGVRRDLLVRRAYLNPTGRARDPEAEPGSPHIPFSRYRPHLMRAGFEVIDCPALTKGQKNAADIRMVIDVLDVVAGPVRYDEVIVASSDSDFTPLLVRLRAADRRTMIVTAGTLAPPYRAVADRHVADSELISLLTGAGLSGEPDPEAPTPLEDSTPAPGPATPCWQPDIVAGTCSITGMPRLTTASWQSLFANLEAAAAEDRTTLSGAGAWVRDRQAEAGLPVGRTPISFVIRGAWIGGAPLDQKPAPSAIEIRKAFLRAVIERAEAAGAEVSPPDIQRIDAWLRGAGRREPAPVNA